MILEPIDPFPYKGHTFYLEPASPNPDSHPGEANPRSYRIAKVECSQNPLLEVPGTYQGCPIRSLSLQPVQGGDFITELHLPAETWEIQFDAHLTLPFPHLKRLSIDGENPQYETDGRCLYTKGKKRLLRCMTAEEEEPLSLPEELSSIGPYAFTNTSVFRLSFPNLDLYIDETAFTDSLWQERHQKIRVIHNHLFHSWNEGMLVEATKKKGSQAPPFQRYYCEDFPANQLFEIKYPEAVDLVRELAFLKDASISLPSLQSFPSLQSLFFPEGHRKYASIDGVLFSKDKKDLLFYPYGRKEKIYEVPEGTVTIAQEAFFEHPYLEGVRIPLSLEEIGVNAFSYCLHLQNLYFKDPTAEHSRLTVIKKGAFAGCDLQPLTLPNSVLSLEEASLPDITGHLTLPPSVLLVGQAALFNVPELTLYRGTAKNVIESIYNARIHVLPMQAETLENLLPGIKEKKQKEIAEQEERRIPFTFYLPCFLLASTKRLLSDAWNTDAPLLPALAAVFHDMGGTEVQRDTFALTLYRFFPEAEDLSPLASYLKKNAIRICLNYLQDNHPIPLQTFLRYSFLSPDGATFLLGEANRLNRPKIAAYLLDYRNTYGEQKKSDFPL